MEMNQQGDIFESSNDDEIANEILTTYGVEEAEIPLDTIYVSANTEKIVSDIFSGRLPLQHALESIRTRLLDLSSRNRLLSYRHPKGRSIQFAGNPNLNLVFTRLLDGKSLQIKHVPEPPPNSYTGRRPEAKAYALDFDISTDFDFPSSSCEPTTNKHTPKLQALLYPQDLEKLCRKTASEARTVIEETGSNMLYLIFGFLEFYDSDNSERPLLAPLISVPVTLEKGGVDANTRTYQYSILYSGEDTHENQTLREKLSKDFLLQMPTFDEDDEPRTYFSKIEKAIETKNRWKVRYQLTLGFLSFGKLAIWADLDSNKWPGLLENKLLKEVFSGGTEQGGGLFPEDYEIDKHPQGEPPIIYDADSSQHSAIIDVLSGKNMVINGPPGTGKSQTITNIIAAGLKNGKRILFVSEKLAALEVVRHRLNHANLGHFCLELHSHKTQKKKLLEDISDRMEKRFPPIQQLENKIATLQRFKTELNRYAELMGSCFGNELGLTINEIFWKTDKHRQFIGNLANAVSSVFFPHASTWSYSEIEYRRSKLEALGQLHSAIGVFDSSHAWWGFTPNCLAPGDDEAIGKILGECLNFAKRLDELVQEYQHQTGETEEPKLEALEQISYHLNQLPVPPKNIIGELLPRIFISKDYMGKRNTEILKSLISKVEQARKLSLKAKDILMLNSAKEYNDVEGIINFASKELKSCVLNLPLVEFDKCSSLSKNSLSDFEKIQKRTNYSFHNVNLSDLKKLNDKISRTAPLTLYEQPCKKIQEGAALLSNKISILRSAFKHVARIAESRGIDFDGSPFAISTLGRPDGIDEILAGAVIDADVISKTKHAMDHVLSDLPLFELKRRQEEIIKVNEQINRILNEFNNYAQQLNFDFDGTLKSLAYMTVIGQICSSAPNDLLDYRRPSLAHPGALELLTSAEKAQSHEKAQRDFLTDEFYLDALPNIEDLKQAIRTFRNGDSLFNIFSSDWRSAKKLYLSISKNKKGLNASIYELNLSKIIDWLECKNSFTNNQEYKDCFGSLFRDVDTDFSKISRLVTWYAKGHQLLLEQPGFVDSINLSLLESNKIMQFGMLNKRFKELNDDLSNCKGVVDILLEPCSGRLSTVLQQEGWNRFNSLILKFTEEIRTIYKLFTGLIKQDVSPKRGFELFNARMEISDSKSQFEALFEGVEDVRKVEQFLPGIGLICCERWGDYLQKIEEIALYAGELGALLSEFSDNDSTPRTLCSFVDAKISLDSALDVICNLSEFSVSDWNTYVLMATKKVEAATVLVAEFLSAGESSKTSTEIIEGLIAKKEAKDIINALATDTDIADMLQDLFQGMETNLESIADTISWGEQVINVKPIRLSSMSQFLLHSDASHNLLWAKDRLERIIELRNSLSERLDNLSDFGALTQAEWYHFDRQGSHQDFASTLLERILFAFTNVSDVLPWSKYVSERQECRKAGLEEFVQCIELKKVPPESAGSVFEYVAYRSIGRSIYKQFPELDKFSGAKHGQIRSDFASLDREIIGTTGKSFAYSIDRMKNIPQGHSGYKVSEKTEMHLLVNELGKQRRHIPIRQLLRRAGRAIQALKPCFMMGPMSVAQYLEHGALDFDMVVMDEASQLRPEESLGAIARGKQLIVVGDPKQLPPMNFFDRLVDDGDDDDSESTAILAGSESILDICQQLFHPVRTLRWHYRSQHESLIAFSNHHFYKGKLIVFPSRFDRNNRLGLRYRYIKNGVYLDRRNVPEAQRVVDAVIEHMIARPDESLGVVTLNQTQRDLIEDLLDKKMRNINQAQIFTSDWEEKGWPFFVKNLENVQGDERDVIYISTTFGKAPGTIKPRQLFGPISRPDGWRRLNVLFTRSRKKIELFTSLQPEDIVIDVKTPAGTRALRDYLEYARTGILSTTEVSGKEPDSDFEISVMDWLQNQGYEVVPQVGVAGFFIDLAVRNPDRPGEFLAAIECDGATYHSSSSARDRDRIRQDILESLGWKDRIWRIWSTDWFYSPRRESERLLEFLKHRQALSKSEPEPTYEFEEDEEVSFESSPTEASDENVDYADVAVSPSTEELFVEVGDRVTYCAVNKNDEKHCVMIVDSESNTKLNLINENTALAQALLNAAVGDEVELEIKGTASRTLRVIKIQRGQE